MVTNKYLGQDEDIGFNGTVNKEKVTKKYFQRVREIWLSELYAKNKVAFHNIFAIPIIRPIIGIIDWSKEELSNIDLRPENYWHQQVNINSDIDRLYSYRNKGDRGFNSPVDIYISRLVSINSSLMDESRYNTYLALLFDHEKESLVRAAN